MRVIAASSSCKFGRVSAIIHQETERNWRSAIFFSLNLTILPARGDVINDARRLHRQRQTNRAASPRTGLAGRATEAKEPIIHIALSHLRILDHQRIVHLRAQSRGGPVGRADQNGLRLTLRVYIKKKLVMYDVPARRQPIPDLARRRIRELVVRKTIGKI